MKQAVLAVILLIILVFIFSGGFSVKDQADPIPSPNPVIGELVGEGDPSANEKALQLRNLRFTTLSPIASTAPSAQPSNQPSATPSCTSDRVAVNLLLDTSSSMCGPGSIPCPFPTAQSKITKLKQAVAGFLTNLNSDDVVGAERFSTGASTIISPNLVSINRSSLESQVNALVPLGTTNMLGGFNLAKQEIDLTKPSFPDHNWVLIFITDGVPTDPGGFPNADYEPTAVATLLKQEGVRIITIGLDIDRDPEVAYIKNMLGNEVASSPTDFYNAPSGSDLNSIYQQIANSICR